MVIITLRQKQNNSWVWDIFYPVGEASFFMKFMEDQFTINLTNKRVLYNEACPTFSKAFYDALDSLGSKVEFSLKVITKNMEIKQYG